MSKFCYIFVAFAILSLLPDYVCADLNMIDNPSVEVSSCGEPVDWLHTSNVGNISVFDYKENGVDGSRSLGINVLKFDSGEEFWSFMEIPISENSKDYRYSAQYKSTIPSKLVLITKNSSGVESNLKIADYPAQDVWTRISVDVPLPKDAVTMRVVHVVEENGTIQLDDFLLEEKKQQATVTNEKNLIPNYSLEVENKSDLSWPENWQQRKNGSNNVVFTYLNNGHFGTKSIKMTTTDYVDGHSNNYFKPISIQGGESYEYSFFHKSDVYTEVNAEITLASGVVVYQFLGVTFPSNTWTKFSTRLKMPNTAVKVSLYNVLYSVGTITQDDFELSQVQVVPFNRPIISVTFDDSFKSFYDIVFPMFKSRGLSATTYVPSGNLNTPKYMTSNDLKQLHAAGFEIGSHTVTHAHLPFLSNLAANTELVKSKNDIANLIEVIPKNFASPYGEYNDQIKKQVSNLYRSHRSTDVGYNSKDDFDILNIKTQNITDVTSPEAVLEWVDTAIKNKTWLVLVYHDISDSNSGKFTNTAEHLERVLDGLVAREVLVTNVDAALDEVEPQIKKYND